MSEEIKKAAQQPEQAAAPAEQAAEAKPEAAPEKDKKEKGSKKHAAELEAAKARAEAAEKEAAEAKDRLLRTAAEYENFRKRSAREADQKFGDGVSHAVNQILGILDTLDMAANAPCADENYKKGVCMTLDKAEQALAKLNISEIEALGKEFDPNTMNAVQQVPAQDGQKSGVVANVFQKGYKINEKVVRPAMVKTAN